MRRENEAWFSRAKKIYMTLSAFTDIFSRARCRMCRLWDKLSLRLTKVNFCPYSKLALSQSQLLRYVFFSFDVSAVAASLTRFTQWRINTHSWHKLHFYKKNQMLQNGFLISVTLRWHSGVKNHEILTFKVNFLCQKTSESFYKKQFSLKNINLGPHFL